MAEAFLKKVHGGFVPDQASNDPDTFSNIKNGQVIKVTYTVPRNYKFHKKYFALLNIAYDAFEPASEHKGVEVEKKFNRFRKDVAIMSGYYDVVPNIKGEPRLEAKSISFATMGEDEFEDLYNKSVKVILKYVLTNYMRSDLDSVVEQVIRF